MREFGGTHQTFQRKRKSLRSLPIHQNGNPKNCMNINIRTSCTASKTNFNGASSEAKCGKCIRLLHLGQKIQKLHIEKKIETSLYLFRETCETKL